MLYAKARKMMGQGCKTFIAILVSSSEPIDLVSIPMILEILDVYLDDLWGIPPTREVEFTIDVARSTVLISKTPYRRRQ